MALKKSTEVMKDQVRGHQLRALRADVARYQALKKSLASRDFLVVAFYRLRRHATQARPRFFWKAAAVLLRVCAKFVGFISGAELSPQTSIGPGLVLMHAKQILVDPEATIGANCTILHGCTIGKGPRPGTVTIGDDVFIGCYSTLLGAITIGDSAEIAANTLVLADVPAQRLAIGVPAKIAPHLRAFKMVDDEAK
jgi:putative colanic acid biosynthesis acetyltransferase WcaB